MKNFEFKMVDLMRKACKVEDGESEVVVLKGDKENQRNEIGEVVCEDMPESYGKNLHSSSSDDDEPGVVEEVNRSRVKSRKLIRPQEHVKSKVSLDALVGWLECCKDETDFESIMVNHGFRFTTYSDLRLIQIYGFRVMRIW
jgi:hypothetical protein